ncbi:MAG: SDR family oxidoreductase [Deltaproteobacteria bacterium]|nr:SDR family oxidoreductase [Deltaproteobacteria bacterium]
MNQSLGGVVVTGSSSGIGRAAALALDRAGFRVFAGVRKEKDAEALRAEASPNLTPLFLDITDGKMISEAVRTVEGAFGGAGLHGLVNNAGVGFFGPLEFLPIDQFRAELDINVTGQLAVTQALLPFIRKAKGRIVNIGSIAGRLALPFSGAISVSKHAIEAMSDVLRMELAPWGVHVVLVEPGLTRTEAVEKAHPLAEQLLKSLPPAGQTYFGDLLRKFNAVFLEQNRDGSPPEEIAQVVLRALTVAKPNARYAVGKMSTKAILGSATLPDWLLDRVRKKRVGLPTEFGALL